MRLKDRLNQSRIQAIAGQPQADARLLPLFRRGSEQEQRRLLFRIPAPAAKAGCQNAAVLQADHLGDLPGIDAAGEKIHHLHRLSLGVAVEIPTAGREIDVGQIRPAGGGAQIGSISWQYRRFLPAKGFEIQSRKPALLHLLSGTRRKVPNAQGVSAAAEAAARLLHGKRLDFGAVRQQD